VTLGASYGDAFLAAMGVGLVDEPALTDEWVEIQSRVEPDPQVVPVYEELYGVYRDLYTATADQVHALARLGR
jgi:xylulokinase